MKTLYEFFLNDLCDVYLEAVKPIVYGTEKKSSELAKMTLWVCLDVGLRALHPLCPFVTEELWQRLPRSSEVTSIMVAPYPTLKNSPFLKRDSVVEDRTALVLKCATAARSLRAQYDLKVKVPAKFFVIFKDPALASHFEAQKDDFITAVNAESLQLLNTSETQPPGCAIFIVDEAVTVLIDLKGLVDVDAEIAKLQKQIADLAPLINKLQAKQCDPTYLEKAPEKLRQADADKLAQYATRSDAAQNAIAMWQGTQQQQQQQK